MSPGNVAFGGTSPGSGAIVPESPGNAASSRVLLEKRRH